MQNYPTRIFGRPSNRLDWDRLQASNHELSEKYSREMYDTAIFWLGRSNGLLPSSKSQNFNEAPAALGHFRSEDCRYFYVYWLATPLLSETNEPIRAFVSLPADDYRLYGFSPFELYRAGYFAFAEDCWRKPSTGRCQGASGSNAPSFIIPDALSKLPVERVTETIPSELQLIIPALGKVMQGEDLLLTGDELDASRDQFLEMLWWCLPEANKMERSFGTFAFPDVNSLKALLESVAPIVGCCYAPHSQNWKEVAGVTEYLANPSKSMGGQAHLMVEKIWGEYLQQLNGASSIQSVTIESTLAKRENTREQFNAAADKLISISTTVENVRNLIVFPRFDNAADSVLSKFVDGVDELKQAAECLMSNELQLEKVSMTRREENSNSTSVEQRLDQIEKRIARICDFEKGIKECCKAGCWVSQSKQFGRVLVEWKNNAESGLSIIVRPGVWRIISENSLEVAVDQISTHAGTEFQISSTTDASPIEWLNIGRWDTSDVFFIQVAIFLPMIEQSGNELGVLCVRESHTPKTGDEIEV